MLDTALTYDDFGREIGRTVTDSSGGTLIKSSTWLRNCLLETKTTQCNGNLVRIEMYEDDVRNRLTGHIISVSSLPQDAYGLSMTSYQNALAERVNGILKTSCKLPVRQTSCMQKGWWRSL